MKNVKKYLEQIKSSNKFDKEYVDCLIRSIEESDDKYDPSQAIIALIKKRYDKNKKDSS